MSFFCWNFVLENRFFLVSDRFFKPVSEIGGRSAGVGSRKKVSHPALPLSHSHYSTLYKATIPPFTKPLLHSLQSHYSTLHKASTPPSSKPLLHSPQSHYFTLLKATTSPSSKPLLHPPQICYSTFHKSATPYSTLALTRQCRP